MEEFTKEFIEEEKEFEEKIKENIMPVTYSERDLIEERKKKVIDFFKKQKDWIYYTILGFIVLLSAYLRTRSISKLKDITTETWTLGPDLDPYLFLRWAEYIVENGKLMALDMMRNVPLGHNTAKEMILHPYLIAWFHNFLSFFSLSDSVTYSAIIFPVFMTSLAVIAFFLFARKIFYKEDRKTRNIIALIATGIFALLPSLLPRTIAGIPEKESAALFFMFIAFYFFLESFTSKTMKKSLIFGLLAGIFTGLMALVWGGVTFVYLTISATVLFTFILGKIDKKRFYSYGLWILGSSLIPMMFSARYNLPNLIRSISTNSGYVIFLILFIHFFLFNNKIRFNEKINIKAPKQVVSIVVSIVVLIILSSIFLEPMFIPNQVKGFIGALIHPLDVTRFGLTVAENKQPFFTSDWRNIFGPIKFGIPLFFWLFFIGSVVMFNHLIKSLRKKERLILTFSYFIFLIGMIFSKYSPSSVLNGDTNLSLFVYFGGILFFLGSFGYIYLKKYNEGSFLDFKEFNFAYILYFLILTMAIIGARGGVRLIMILAAINPIVVAFLTVKISQRALREKDETMRLVIGLVAIMIIISLSFTSWTYYNQTKDFSERYGFGPYQFQWQKAMSWVRDNTPIDSVFAHWWDYGYWVQSIGERATILDGGNAIVYWNHLMGRHVLTGTNERDALEFLYTHNGTHLLIDATEIGKYTAFSSIGSDEDYDRFSWISTFQMDESQIQETKDEATYVYVGGMNNDEDVVWNYNGEQILLPKKAAGVGAVIIKMNLNKEISQPEAIFVYNNQQYRIPLRYVYYKNELKDFGSGIEAGIFIYPKVNVDANSQLQINEMGSLLYLSERTINSNLARLYLFDKDSDNFKLAHMETDIIVEEIRQQVPNIGEFIQYQGFRGPIKIWEISYPANIESKPEYLERKFPNKELKLAKKGEYN